MKKLFIALLAPILFLIGCNSNTKSGQSTIPVTDTSKMHVVQPVADTNIKDGPHIVRFANGVMKEKSEYVAGKRQGECQSFYESGKLMSDCFFTAGLSDGPCSTYYESGQKRYEGNYAKGKPSGIWNFYDEKGKLIHTKNYGKTAAPSI